MSAITLIVLFASPAFAVDTWNGGGSDANWATAANWVSGVAPINGTIHGVASNFDPFSLMRNNTPIKAEGTNFYYTGAINDYAVADIDKYAGGTVFHVCGR